MSAKSGFAGAVVVLLAAFALFSPFFLRGEAFVAADTLKLHLPWRAAAPQGFRPHNPLITDSVNSTSDVVYNAQLKRGGLPLWNPGMFMGLPATGVTAMPGAPGRLFPPKLLLNRLLPPAAAFMLLNFVYVASMGLTMLAFLRAIGAGPRGAVFGALAFMLNGYLLVWLSCESVAASAALAPLALLAIERYRGPRRLTAALAGGGVLGSVGLMGMAQYVLCVWLVCLAYLAFTAARALRAAGAREALRVLACFAVTAPLALLIPAVELLPAWDLIASSGRIARDYSFQELFDTLGALPGRYLVTLIFPDFFGSPTLHFNLLPRLPTQEQMNYGELCVYVGVPTLFALLGALVASRRAHAWFFLGLAAAAAAMAGGSVLYRPLFALVPGMDRTNPLRLLFVFALAAAAAAGLGVGALEEAFTRGRRAFLAGCALLAAAVLVFALLADRPATSLWFDREVLATGRGGGGGAGGERAPAQPGGTVQGVRSLRKMRAVDSPAVALPLGLVLASAALFAAFAAGGRWRRTAFPLIVTVLAADLIGFGWRYNTRSRPEELYPETPSLTFLRALPGPFRVALDRRGGFMTNSLVPFGIEEIGGYSSFYPERAGRLLAAAEHGAANPGARLGRWVQLSRVDSPLLDVMSVKYVLTAGYPPLDPARYRLIHRGDFLVWENLTALPRAYVARQAVVQATVDEALGTLISPSFDRRTTVVLEEPPGAAFLADTSRAEIAEGAVVDRHSADAVSLTVSLASRGWLVLADAWHPGWEATVDGVPARILRANVNFRALPLRAGSHRVEFVFNPRSVRLGGVFTGIGLLLLAAGAAVSRRLGARGLRRGRA